MSKAVPGVAFLSGKARMTKRFWDGGTGCGGTGGLPGIGIGGTPRNRLRGWFRRRLGYLALDHCVVILTQSHP